jgi:hypothetical protein
MGALGVQEVSMHFELRIFPGLVPDDRHQIEDLIDEHLSKLGVEVCGGGGFVDGSRSDIAFITENIEAAKEVVKFALHLEPDNTFELYSSESKSIIEIDEVPYSTKKWWHFWR